MPKSRYKIDIGFRSACALLAFFGIFLLPEMSPAMPTPGQTDIISFPFQNAGANGQALANVRMSYSHAPTWLRILSQQLGPASIQPGSQYVFNVYYQVDSSFSPSAADVEMDFSITMDNTDVYPSAASCHLSSPDGLQTRQITCADNNGVVFLKTLFPDKTPPVTTLTPIIQPFGSPPGPVYITTASPIVLTAVDPAVANSVVSGVSFTGYLVDPSAGSGVGLMPYLGQFFLPEGQHTILFGSQDVAGNTEATISATIFADGTPPRTSIQFLGTSSASANGSVFLGSSTLISLSGLDPVSAGVASGLSRILVSTDGNAPFLFSTAFGLSTGTHQLSYFGIDNAENVEATHSLEVFVGIAVDTQPPTTQLLVIGTSTLSGGTLDIQPGSSISLVATDLPAVGNSGVRATFYLIDPAPSACSGGAPTQPPNPTAPPGSCQNDQYSGPFAPSSGQHTIYYWSVDNAGNVEPIHATLVNVMLSGGGSGPPVNPPGPVAVSTRSSSALELVWSENGNHAGTEYFIGIVTAPAANPCAIAIASAAFTIETTTPDYIVRGLLASTTYLAQVCDSAGCAQPIVAQTGNDGIEQNPPFFTCTPSTGAGGGGGGPPQSGPNNGLAIAFDASGQAWEVVQDNGNFELARYSGGVLKGVTSLPQAVNQGIWIVSFDTTTGNTYAVGASSGPATVGRQLTAYTVSPQGVLLSSAGYSAGVNGRATGLDASGDVWIVGTSELGAQRSVLALWHFCPHLGLLNLATTFSHGLADVGFGVRVVSGNIWVAGYTLNSQTNAADLDLLEYDATGKNLIAGPFIKAGYLPNVSSRPSGRLETDGAHLFIAAQRAAGGAATGLAFDEFDLAGHALVERAWNSSAGLTVVPRAMALDGSGNLNVAGGLGSSPAAASLGVWKYSMQAKFVSAATDPGIGQGEGIAMSPAIYLAVDGSSQPYRFQGSQALAGTDVFISSMSPDTTPPVSSLAVGRPYFVAADSTQYVSPASSITLSAYDPANADGSAGSGVAQIQISLDSAPFSAYVSTVSLAEGRHVIQYRAVDNAGNVEAAHAAFLRSDATAPQTALAETGGRQFGAYASSATSFSFLAQDPVSNGVASGIAFTHWQDDGGAVQSSTGPFFLPEGVHALSFQSQDNVKNLELLKNATVFVDATAPVTTLSIGQPQFALSSSTLLVGPKTPFSLSAVDPVSRGVASGVKQSFYQLDAGAPQVYAASFTLTGDGRRAVGYYSVDNVGNAEVAKSSSVILVSAPPKISLLCPAQNPGGVCRVFKGRFPVLGSISDAYLASWVLDYAPGRNASAGFIVLSSQTAAVSSATLTTWDASALSGWQTLRLTATDLVQNQAQLALNVFIGDPGELMILGGHDVFSQPSAVAVDQADKLYVADTNHDRIAVFTAGGAFIQAFGSSESDQSKKGTLKLHRPQGVTVDVFGNIFIADTDADSVLKLSPQGQLLQTYAGLKKPQGLALDAQGDLFVADAGNHQIKELAPTGSTLLAIPMPRLAQGKELGAPRAVALDSSGNIYAADAAGARALKFDPAGKLNLVIPVVEAGKPGAPRGIAADAAGQCLLVSDERFDRVLRFDALGDQDLSFGAKREDEKKTEGIIFKKPSGIALDAQGTLYVADRLDDAVKTFGLPTGMKPLIIAFTPAAFQASTNSVIGVITKEDGGALKRPDLSALVVPPNAVAADVEALLWPPAVRLQQEEDLKERKARSSGWIVVSSGVALGPASVVLELAGTVTIPYDAKLAQAQGLSEPNLQIVGWNPDKQDYQWMPTVVDLERRLVSAKITRLWQYLVVGKLPPPKQ